jgi:hypothetical protein
MSPNDRGVANSSSPDCRCEVRIASMNFGPIEGIVSVADRKRNRFSVGISFAGELGDDWVIY